VASEVRRAAIAIEDVLEATSASAEITSVTSARIRRLRSTFSGTASITRSESTRSSRRSV
jgi:hypothetical protein